MPAVSDESGAIAPGLACLVDITLTADNLANFMDSLEVQPEGGKRFTVPIEVTSTPATAALAPRTRTHHSLTLPTLHLICAHCRLTHRRCNARRQGWDSHRR